MSAQRPRLLVIDDDADIRDIVVLLFEQRGFDVDALADGIDAVNLAGDYDVILLDLNMPVFDGERLADYWSLSDPARLERVIVLSGYSRFARGRHIPAFAMVQKPFDTTELVAVVEKCVRSS
jgi:two-component system phosphate regulon response regulator OmpR